MSDAWAEARDDLRDARERCFAAIASVLGVTPDRLSTSIRRAVLAYGQDCCQTTLQYAHARDTVPAPRSTPESDPPRPTGATTVGAYHAAPTRVDTLRPRKKAR